MLFRSNLRVEACHCSEERTKNMLLSLGRKELEKLRDEDPRCEVVCHFCHTKYEFDLNELLARKEDVSVEESTLHYRVVYTIVANICK